MVEPFDQIDGVPLLFHGNSRREIQVQHRTLARAEYGWLINGRQEAVPVHRISTRQDTTRIGHNDVSRQRFAYRSEAVQNPGTHARKPGRQPAGEELILRHGVGDAVAVTGSYYGQIIDTAGKMRECI